MLCRQIPHRHRLATISRARKFILQHESSILKPAYSEWRKTSYLETIELNKLERSARNRMGMGAAAVVAGSGSYM